MSDVSRASAIAAELAKTSVFIDYVQRKVPSLGNLANFTSTLTQELKDQADKNGGVSPFTAVFEKVKEVSPGVAAQGFAKAQGFVEYIVREAPDAFDQVKDLSGDVLLVLKNNSPMVFEGAQKAGEAVANFVGENGPEVLEGIGKAGGSIMKLVHTVNPGALKDVLPVASSSASALAEGTSVAGDAVSSGASQLMKVGVPNLSGIGKIAAQGISIISDNAPGALNQAASVVGTVAASAGEAIGSVLNAEVGADIANVALNIIGTSAAVFPFLLPLQIALRDVGFAIQQASYNKEAAQELGVRCEDCSKLIAEMAPRIKKVSASDEEAKAMLDPFVKAVDECTEELKKFAKKGFLGHMFGWKKEGRTLSRLDKRITDTMQNLSMRVDGKMMELQIANSNKLDGLQIMLNGAIGDANDITAVPPEKVADILQKAGCKSSSEVSAEMQSVGFKVEDIAKGINFIANKLEKMDAKLDNLDSKMDSLNENLTAKLDKMMDMAAEKNDALEQANAKMLEAMRDLNEKLVQIPLAMMRQKEQGRGGVQHTEVYSTPNQVEYLSKRCSDIKSKCPHLFLIHPQGVGKKTYKDINGVPGMNGPDGQSHPRGRDGHPGLQPGADGEDGMDGDDGNDGDEGHDGENGEDAETFEIMIEFVKEDKSKGIREYHIEHAGPRGKDDHYIKVPLMNSVIVLDGKGGIGGKGGDGGRGGNGGDGGAGGKGADGRDNQDGGSGGAGGAGGAGGSGGLAGSGGNGANGARVVIHTNDPSVLTLMEFDVSGGDGGAAGSHGQPGVGGAGGNPGEGGQGGVYYEYRADGTAVPRRARNGHKGKAGKKGKNGKPAPSKGSKPGIDGTPGKISFCIYDEAGLKESGGTPFRIVLNRKDLPKLFPIPVNYGKEGPESDPFIFGQELRFGPVLPINIGSISSPASKMLGSITLQTSPAAEHSYVRFPSIPGENKTRYGELSPSSAQTMNVKVPKLKDAGFVLHPNIWPWPKSWSPAPRATAKFNTIFNIDGILQKFSKVDGDHASTRQYDITVDVPLDIVQLESGKAIKVPDSVMLVGNNSVTVTVSVRNKLKGIKSSDSMSKIQLCAAGLKFKPSISSSRKLTCFEAPPTAANDSGYMIVAAQTAVPAIDPQSTLEFQFSIKLPPGGNQLGANMILKSEIFYDGIVTQFSPAQQVRVAAPWPAEGIPGPNDIIFFCDGLYTTEDYNALATLAVTLKMRSVFLDYQHLARENNGKLPSGLWSQHFGKGVAVWLPADPNLSALVSGDDFNNHLRGGGSLLTGEKSTFSLSPEIANVASPVGRRAVTISAEYSLANLRKGLIIDDKRLGGPAVVALTIGILTSLSVERKLQVLADNQIASIVVGEVMLDNYQVVVEAGCCGMGSSAKIFPAQKSPVTIRDILIAAIRTDVSAELAAFAQTGNIQFCGTLTILRGFISTNIVGKSHNQTISLWARDIHSILYAAGVLDDNMFQGPQKATWAPLQQQIKVEASRLESIAAQSHLETKGSGERAMDSEVLRGFSRRNRAQHQKDSIDLGRGNKLVMMK